MSVLVLLAFACTPLLATGRLAVGTIRILEPSLAGVLGTLAALEIVLARGDGALAPRVVGGAAADAIVRHVSNLLSR